MRIRSPTGVTVDGSATYFADDINKIIGTEGRGISRVLGADHTLASTAQGAKLSQAKQISHNVTPFLGSVPQSLHCFFFLYCVVLPIFP